MSKIRNTGYLSKDEYLSGFGKGDKLLPVITLVVYFGAKAWDGPKSLHEMLAVKDTKALAYIADYKLNLLEPATMSDEEIAKLKSDLKDVFFFIKYSGDKEKLKQLIEKSEDFRSLRRNKAEMIRTITDAGIDIPEGEERVNMCLAIEQMRKESEEKGGLKKLFELVKEGFLTVAQAAVSAKLSEEQFQAEMTKAGY